MTSQKTKKRKKSSAQKTPIIAATSTRKSAK